MSTLASFAKQANTVAIKRLQEAYTEDWERFLAEERSKYGLGDKRMARPRKPCRGCGGEKPAGSLWYCDPCKEGLHEKRKESWRIRSRAHRLTVELKPCRRCGGPKPHGGKYKGYCDACGDLPREYARAPSRSVGRKIGRPKKAPSVVRIPPEIRTAWSKGAPNSIIRRKYPNMSDLRKAYTT